jgi:hypothetical protein
MCIPNTELMRLFKKPCIHEKIAVDFYIAYVKQIPL